MKKIDHEIMFLFILMFVVKISSIQLTEFDYQSLIRSKYNSNYNLVVLVWRILIS
jgi:hypothetical protein